MKIVVLDGHTLNPGDLSWDEIAALGEFAVFDRTPDEEILDRANDAEIILTNKTVLRAETIRALPKLKYIGVLATGINVVDTECAASKGVPVTNVPIYGTRSVAQMTMALILELCHHVQHHSDGVKAGRWTAAKDFCYWDHPLIELDGRTIGIVGLGRIGQATAKLAAAFGLKVLAYSRHRHAIDGFTDFAWAELDELFRASDIVSLHCPLTAENEGFVNRALLGRMKPSAFLINTARGRLINEADLADALNQGVIAGAALDVLAIEPPPADNPLLKAKNCIVTPHIAWATREARRRLMTTAAENIKAFLAGRAINVVN